MISSKALGCSHFHVNSVSSATSCFSIISWTLYVVVGHRAIGLLHVLVTSPCRGGAAKICN